MLFYEGQTFTSVLLFFSFLPFVNKVKAQVSATDSLALVDLYYNTNGRGWLLNTNWLSGPVATWYGVSVSNGRVWKIDLSSNFLQGTIPSSVGNLQQLTELDLYFNKLSGTIPASLGNLTSLTTLWLFGNEFTGAIPPSLGSLFNLTTLYLQSNQLSGSIPPTLGKLRNLTTLNLTYNMLSGSIPPSLFTMSNLSTLALDGNQLMQKGNAPIPGRKRSLFLSIFLNRFTFDGLESAVQKLDSVRFYPQANLTIHQYQNKLAVSAGGTLANNTYQWSKSGSTKVVTIQGDSTYQPSQNGTYQVSVTNAVIGDKLTLTSYQYNYVKPTMLTVKLYPNPVKNLLSVSGLDDETDVQITVADMSGYVWLSAASSRQSTVKCDVSRLKPGHYFVNITNGAEVKTLQFVKD